MKRRCIHHPPARGASARGRARKRGAPKAIPPGRPWHRKLILQRAWWFLRAVVVPLGITIINHLLSAHWAQR